MRWDGAEDAGSGHRLRKKRSTFGKQISTRQAIQDNVAQMATEIEAARLLAYEPPGSSTRVWTSSSDAAMAKLFAEQMVARVAETRPAHARRRRLHPAYPLERHFRDCRSFHFEEGTEEIQKLLIARHLLK